MNHAEADVIVALTDVMNDKSLPFIKEMEVTLGGVSDVVPIDVLHRHFQHINIYFTYSNDQFARLRCKVYAEHPITFNVNVRTSDLSKITKETVEYELPTIKL